MHHFHLQNPNDFPQWDARLTWLMDNQPDRLRAMFKTPKDLMKHLDEQTAHAVWAEMREKKAGTPEDAAREISLSMVAPADGPELTSESPPEPMPMEERKKYRTWAGSLPDRTHRTTV